MDGIIRMLQSLDLVIYNESTKSHGSEIHFSVFITVIEYIGQLGRKR